MKKLLHLFCISLILSLLGIIFFSSCEIGLGEAVDTKAPDISITFPDVDTVIRDSFAIQGNWSDDGDIKAIEVVLSRTDTSKKYGPFSAEFQNNGEKKGIWECVITPTDENNGIIDGTYEAEITVKDTVGHVSKATRQFSIDNTPPLLILQRPFTETTVADADTEEYGQLFSLEGQVSDDSNVDHIDINVYKDAAYTNFIKTITIHNPPSTINIDAAVFTEGENNDYSDIYGYTSISEAENAGQLSAVRYCKILTYDKAQRYPLNSEQTAEDTNGNSASFYYIYDDVNTSDLLGKYKITELYKMNSGTYLLGDSSRSANTVSKTLSVLESKKRETSKFKLNPKNNPTFEISGKEPFSGKRGNFSIDSESKARISNESTIVIDVKPGLDNYTINKDSLRPYLIPCNEDGSLLIDDIENNRIYITTSGNCEKNGSSYKFAVPLKTGMISSRFANEDNGVYTNSNTLLIGGYYCFGMEGSDIKGKSVVSNGYYAFKFETNGSLNTIKELQIKIDDGEFESKDIIYAKDNTIVDLKGVAYSSDPSISDDGKITASFDGNPIVITKDGQQILENGYYKQKFIASFNVGTKTTGQEYSLVINASEESTKITIPVKYDAEKPTVVIGTPSPYDYIHQEVGEDENAKFLNKTVSVNISVSDNDSVKSAVAELQQKVNAEWVTLKRIPTTSGFANWNISADTSGIDNATVRIKVTATDRSGNKEEKLSPEFNVKQESDKPTAKPGDESLTLTATTSDYDFKGNDKNLRASGGNLSFSIFDDDGIKNAEIKVYSKDAAEGSTPINSAKLYSSDKLEDAADLKKKDNFSFRLLGKDSNGKDTALDAGIYKVVLSMEDYGVDNSYTFFVKITAPAPAVRIENVVSKVTTNTASVVTPVNTVENKIFISSNATTFKVERSIAGDAYSNITSTVEKIDGSAKELLDKIAPETLGTKASGEYQIDYKVTDEENQSTVVSTKFYVDNAGPVVSALDSAFINKLQDQTENSAGDVEFTAKESSNADFQSGVSKVVFKIGSTGTERNAVLDKDKWTGTITYKEEAELYNQTTQKFAEGQKTIYVYAIDEVGNKGTQISATFNFDREPPKAEITQFVKTGSGETTPQNIENSTFNYGKEFSLKGTASDTKALSSDVSEWKLIQTKDGTDSDITTGITYDPASGTWTAENLPRPSVAEGTYTYKILVKDWTGKEATSKEITMKVDFTDPVLTDFTIPAELKGASKTWQITATDKDSTGTAEGTGVKAIYYAFTTSNTAPAKGNSAYNIVKNNQIRREFGTGPKPASPAADTLYEGQHYLHLYVEDYAGNSSSITTKGFYIDQSAPEVELTQNNTSTIDSVHYLNKTTTNKLTLKGKITETNALSSFVIKRDATQIKSFAIGTGDGKEIVANPDAAEWNITDNGIEEGEHEYSFVATDVRSHKNPELKFTIFVDTKEPEFSTTDTDFTVPQDGDTESAYFTFKGTAASVTDPGSTNASGIDKILIGFSDNTANLTAPQTTAVNVTINNGGDWEYPLEFAQYKDTVFKVEGPKKVWLQAWDKAGNSTTWKTIDFTYDTTAPTITGDIKVGDESKNGGLINKTFTISGTAADTYEIKEILVYILDSDEKIKIYKYTPAANAKETSKDWSKTIKLTAGKSGDAQNPNDLKDGVYTFYICVTDMADKTTTLERSATIDTTAPTINSVALTNASSGTNKELFDGWLNTRTVKIAVEPNDDNLTGVDTVSYTLVAEGSRSEGSWIDLTKQTSGDYSGKYTGNIALTQDGTSTVYFRVKDKAGNASAVTSCPYKADTVKPTIGKLYNAAGKELTGNLLVDGVNGAKFKVYLDATDEGGTAATGIASITYNGNDTGINKTTAKKPITVGEETKNLYEITIEKANQTDGNLTFVVTDGVNNQQSYTPLELQVDSKDPTITDIKVNNVAPSSNAISNVNGNLTITATVADKFNDTKDGRLASVKVEYSLDTGDTKTWYPFSDDDSITTSSAKENLSITHRFSSATQILQSDTTNKKLTLKDDKTTQKQEVWFKITATDEANHTVTSEPVKITIDRDKDIPVVKFNNITLGTTMSSSKHVWLENTTQLQGTVTDDDGIEKIELSLNGTDWDEATLDDNGSNWNYDIKKLDSASSPKDKERNVNKDLSVYLRITDKENNVFVSKAKADVDYETLKLQYDTTTYGVKNTTDSILYVKPETLPPEVEIKGAKVNNSGATDYEVTYGSMIVGGTRDGFSVKFTAWDGNGIKQDGVSAIAKFTNDKDGDNDTQTTVPVNGVITPADDGSYYIATFTPTDTIKNSNKTGKIEFSVTALDNKDKSTTQTQTISYDYKKPVVSFREPSETNVNSGSISAYGSVSENAVLEYAVSLSGTTSPALTEALANSGTAVKAWTGTKSDTTTSTGGTATTGVKPFYKKLSDYGTSWFIYFDGANSADGNVHDQQLKDWFVAAGVTTNDAIEGRNGATKFENIVDTYLWIKATDDVGNVSQVRHKIRVDSQGDRPKVTISYPNKAGLVIGDTVNIYGSAEPQNTNTMKYVWVQLIKGYDAEHQSSVTAADLTLLKGKGYPVYKISDPTTEWNGTGTSTDYAIKIDTEGSTGWKLQLKKDLAGDDKTNFGIVVYAQDEAGHLSQQATQWVTFDASSPVISDVYLKQYVGSELKATRKYEEPETESDKMWLSSKHGTADADWYLTFKVKDTDLDKIYFGKTINGSDAEITSFETGIPDTEKRVKIKLKTESYNTTIKATDKSNQSTTITFMVGFDSIAPVLPSTDAKISNSVTNSNGYYKFESSVTENGSGVDFVAFYFKRAGNVFDVMLPQKDSSGNAYTNNRVAVTDDDNKGAEGLYWLKPSLNSSTSYDENSVTVKGAIVNAHKGGLIRIDGTIYIIDSVTITGSGDSAKTKIIFNGTIPSATNIEIALANVVNNTTKESAGTGTRITTKTYGYGYATPLNDDGDMIIEYLSKQNEWMAGINSRNIPDGPVELHYVVYDKAGNYADKKIDTLVVSNNAPRIAGVQIRTDYDGDGLFTSAGETFADYSAATLSSGSVTGTTTKNSKSVNVYDPDEENTTTQEKKPISYTDSTEFIIAGPNNGTSKTGFAIFKGKTEIEPEIVGGNGQITYTHTWKDSAGTTVSSLTNSSATNFITGTDDYTINSAVITLQVGDLLKAGEAKTVATVNGSNVCTNPHNLEFVFSDSTEGATANSTIPQTAKLSMYFGVNVVSEDPATASISPFYWESAEKNSIYGSTTGTTIKTLQGHIELKDDWTPESGVTTGQYDADPKVSGKVVVKGQASDPGRIKEILINIPGMDLTGQIAKYLVSTTSGDTTTQTLTTEQPASGDYETYYQVAVEESTTVNGKTKDILVSKAAAATNFTGKGYQFIIDADSNTYTADGHTVAWTLNWDTEKLKHSVSSKDYNTAADVPVKVLVVNQGEPSCTGQANTDATHPNKGLTGYYPTVTYPNQKFAQVTDFKVDVVPYVTSLETTLSAADPDNSSVYGRSATGSYPVYHYSTQRPGKSDKDIITVNGFNLAGGVVTFQKFDTALDNNTAALTADASDGNKLKFELPSNAKSGEVYITVGGVQTLNNQNNNNSKGTYTTTSKAGTYNYYKGYYNRQANNMNNDILTDDLSVSVWELNAQALAVTSDLTRPVMHVNPKNGMLGFAYSNGQYFYMPKGNNNSYSYWSYAWNAFNSVGFTYDPAGNVFAVHMGTDSYSTTAYSKLKLVSSVWAETKDTQEYSPYNSLRLESMNGDTTRFDNHPKMVATNPSDGTTNLYLMYYDPSANEIICRTGYINHDNGSTNKFINLYKEDNNGSIKIGNKKYSINKDDNVAANNLNNQDVPTNSDYNTSRSVKTIFGDYWDDASAYAKNNRNYSHCSVVANSSSTYQAGTNYSIAVIPSGTTQNGDTTASTTDTLVAAWVDPINDKVVYGYLENPLVNNHKKKNANGTISNSIDATPNNMWTLTSVCDYAGGYCAIATDNNGGVHIAYYSKERGGSLKYTYISKYNGTPVTYFVDSYGATGRNLTIDFAKNRNSYIPYIGYYTSMKKPKYAYPVAALSNGADEENMYLGTWESMYIPTLSSINADDNIQIGVYHDANGARANIPVQTDTGKVGGNGTDNPIIGYATSYVGNGYFETAQLR